MKRLIKTIFAGLAITSILFVVGCGGTKHIEDERSDRTFQGELTELSSFISGLDVTHVLVTDAKERVFLRSLLFDLVDYENKEVRVTGAFTEEDVSDKPVNVLTVEKIDILSDVNLFGTDLDEMHASEELGIRFSFPSLLFDVKETDGRIMMSAVDDDAALTMRKFKTSIEIDAQVYISANYDSFEFDEVKVGSGLIDAYTNAGSSPDKVVYILLRTGHFYELTFTNFGSDVDSKYDQVFDEMLATLEYTALAETEEDESDDKDGEEDKDEDEESSEDSQEADTSDEDVEEAPSEELTSTGSSKDPVINAFYAVDEGFITADSYVSFAFTDNNYFYVIYTNDDIQKRALFSYTDDNSFTKVADFKKGTVQDWDLVSGNNVAYNRPLTLVIVGEEGSEELALEQGYRYFESLPLGFGMQYPMDWYYARTDDEYEFSDKPLDVGKVLVSAEVLDEKFSDMPGNKVNNMVKQANSTTYYIDLEDDVLKISGKNAYADEIRVMATSVVVKNNEE